MKNSEHSTTDCASPQTVVVGACGHGLMLVRALHRAGLRTLLVEADRTLPGCLTGRAPIHYVDDINGLGLIDALMQLVPDSPHGERPVLILTNDRMVETVASHIDAVETRYRVSWAAQASAVAGLLKKSAIESRCREAGLNYPRTVEVHAAESLVQLKSKLDLPIIIKPVAPVSAFKTIVIEDWPALDAAADMINSCLPVIAQDFIAGGDESIAFGAMYLRNGKVAARFEGEKIRSRPMGHTTIAVSRPSDEVHALAKIFFEGLGLSGPVSLELKRDPEGKYWVIEPTLGRTDYWVGLCIDNGVNLPALEAGEAAGLPAILANQRSKGLWINEERDPLALLWLLVHRPSVLVGHRISSVYMDSEEWRPMLALLARHLREFGQRLARRIKQFLSLRSDTARS